MFKKISSALYKKEQNLDLYEKKTARLEAVFQSFLAERFNGLKHALDMIPEYNSAEKELLISAPSKAFAAELSFHLEEIKEVCKSAGLETKRIIIRTR